MSYDSLPLHLKACFLYTSMFPEDAYIPTKKLKWLWAAEGFLKPTADTSVEVVAEKCLVDLVDRNLLFVGKRRSNGKIKTCTVHDLLRDLSLRKAREDKFSQQTIAQNAGRLTKFTKTFCRKHMPWLNDNTDSNSQLMVYRRSAGVSTSTFFSLFNKKENEYFYSLTCHTWVERKDLLHTMRSNLLRVLEVLGTSYPCVAFGANLRYLAFATWTFNNAEFSAQLENVRKLKNLETLIIKQITLVYQDLVLPILEMPKLKHFVVLSNNISYWVTDNDHGVTCNPVSRSNLMQTLSGVRYFSFSPDAVEIFVNLLKLKAIYRDFAPEEWYRFYPENLSRLHQLEELTLICDISLPTNITFPGKLKKITLKGPIISLQIMSAIGLLPYLEVLKLVDCTFESSEWEPTEGEFQQLKYLKLSVSNLDEWKVESYHFPCLEQLILSKCNKLKELPAEVGEIESLQKLVIHECEDHIGDSAKKIQQEQQSYDNYELQVLVLQPDQVMF